MPTFPAAPRVLRLLRALGCGLALAAGVTAGASAQTWPSRPIKLIVPAAPGGSADPIARLISEELGKAVNQSVVVENRPGANGNIGASAASKSAPDGYTLLLGWPGNLVSAVTLYDAKPFHPQKDFEPIVLVGSVPNVIVTHPSLPVTSLQDLTDYAKKNPAKLNFGSTGSGSSYHLSGELYKKTNGVFMVHVPYSSPGAVFTDGRAAVLSAGRLLPYAEAGYGHPIPTDPAAIVSVLTPRCTVEVLRAGYRPLLHPSASQPPAEPPALSQPGTARP